LKVLCEQSGLSAVGSKASLKKSLEALTEQVYHFDNICHPYVWSGLADVCVLCIVCRVNIVVYTGGKALRAVFWHGIDAPTLFIQYVGLKHFKALLPKSPDIFGLAPPARSPPSPKTVRAPVRLFYHARGVASVPKNKTERDQFLKRKRRTLRLFPVKRKAAQGPEVIEIVDDSPKRARPEIIEID